MLSSHDLKVESGRYQNESLTNWEETDYVVYVI